MGKNLSFAIAINLLTENFKRGTNQVKSAFRSMQAQVLTFAAALGAGGIGLSNLVSRFVEVARETSRVTTSLKNVSGSMSQYADNQKYLLDIAKKYGLEINALTGNLPSSRRQLLSPACQWRTSGRYSNPFPVHVRHLV